MLRSLSEIIGYELFANDGVIGKCSDFLFDDRWWKIRYMLADTGGWLTGRKVLVSPIFIEKPDWQTKNIIMNLSKDQIENCPPLREDMPVSEAYEMEYFKHFGYPYYLTGDPMSDGFLDPIIMKRIHKIGNSPESGEKKENHLRSVNEVKGYGISASDGDIGHCEDFIINDGTWELKYMVVDTRNWLPGGKKVLLSSRWIQDVTFPNARIEVDLTKDRIINSPEFNPGLPVNREYELNLYDYYGRPFKE